MYRGRVRDLGLVGLGLGGRVRAVIYRYAT